MADINNLAGYTKNPDFYSTTFIVSCLLFIALNLFLVRLSEKNKHVGLCLLAYSLVPLLAFPLVSVFKDEIFFVLKNNKIVLNSQIMIYLALIILLALIVFLRYKKGSRKVLRNERELVARSYLPLLIFSLTAYTSYSYNTDYYNEIFESGNVYLPIMEYKLFGVLSPLEKLNTHLLSDYFFGAIYTFFNGLKLNEITLYDFMLAPISYTLHYYLFRFLTRNEFVAILCVMFFPYTEAIMPDGFCLAILGVFASFKTFGQKQSLRNYILYFTTLFFLACWRIDLGVNCLVAMPIVLLYYHFRDTNYKINWKILFKAIGIVATMVFVLVGILSFYRGVNFFYKISYLLNYCSSAQSYAHEILGQSNLPLYKMHYFLFPVCVGLIILFLVIKYKRLNTSKSSRLAYLSLFFICVFYLVNFNRGLTRHCLAEGNDLFTSSYVYIIIAGSVFVFLKKENQTIKVLGFFIILFFLVSNYKVPDTKGLKSLVERLENKIEKTYNITLAKIVSRINNAPENYENPYKDFSDFIKKQTNQNETFIDFGNRSMLYFFTKKITPSWFYQNPLCIQNDFLQKKFIEDLQDYKTPYLVFSGCSDIGYDVIDDVPNTLRHYRLAECFYNKYKPCAIINNLCVWQNKTIKSPNKIDTIYKFYRTQDFLNDLIEQKLKIKAEKKYVVKIVSTNGPNGEFRATFNNRTFLPELVKTSDEVTYCVFDLKGKQGVLSLRKSLQQTSEFLVLECDYIPDHVSERFLNYSFKKLPYIWGAFDKLVLNERVLFEDRSSVLLENKSAYKLSISENLDRSTGNTILINCKNTHDKTQKIILSFGNARETNKTNVSFDVVPSNKEEVYAIRVSSIYKWFSGKVDQIIITPEIDKKITITKVQITKGQ
jgi:hypothetical protein